MSDLKEYTFVISHQLTESVPEGRAWQQYKSERREELRNEVDAETVEARIEFNSLVASFVDKFTVRAESYKDAKEMAKTEAAERFPGELDMVSDDN